MNRRSFIRVSAPLILYGPVATRNAIHGSYAGTIMTVNGELPVEKMGLTLTHEHLFSTFGLDPEEYTEYNPDDLIPKVLPFLEQAKSAGCKTIIDCTAAYFGRNAGILKTLSEKSGINILTNTGIYGAANGKYIPAYAHTEDPRKIADRWINEWKNGIGQTGIRPGFMKLGFNSGALSAIDRKLMQAAAITHLACGLTIAAHTSNNPQSAFAQLGILEANKISPSAWIWTHAHDVTDTDSLFKAARMGAWISFDGYRKEKHEWFLQQLQAMKKAGLVDRVILSHDGDGYPQKGALPSSLSIDLFTDLLPGLLKSGFTKKDIQQLTVVNPSKAFAVSVRRI